MTSGVGAGRNAGRFSIGLLVFGVAVLAYVTSLPGVYHYDDIPTILQNKSITKASLLPEYFWEPAHFSGLRGNEMYRPVLLATYLFDYSVAGYRPFVWHLTNVLLHAANAFLVVLLTYGFLRIFRSDRPSGPVALIAGLAFALHPVHSEVANYISSRSGAIATAGFLGAFLCHLVWTRSGRGVPWRGLALLGTLFFFSLGLGGKEIAIALVPSVFALELLDPSAGGAVRRVGRAVLRTAPLVVVAVGYMILRKQILGSAAVDVAGRFFEVPGKKDPLWGGGRSIYENLLTQACVFWEYMRILLFPTELAVDRYFPVYTSFSEWPVWISVCGVVLVGILILVVARRLPLVAMAGLLVFFGLAPTSSLVPLNVVMNEHRLYLPGVGFAILTGVMLAALIRSRPRLGTVLALAVAACYVVVIVPRNLVWQDSKKLWAENVRVSPGSYRGHNQLGAAFESEARREKDRDRKLELCDRAIEEFDTSLKLYPGWFHATLNLGIVYREKAMVLEDDALFEKAIEYFEKCYELSRVKWRARFQIASTYGAWKKYDEALRRFSNMAEEDREEGGGPRKTLYLYPQAKLNLDRGSLPEAEAVYREILEISPKDFPAKVGLAKVLRLSDRQKEGYQVLAELVKEDPNSIKVQLAIAKYLIEVEPPARKRATMHFQKAVHLGHTPTPEEAETYFGN